MAERTDDVVWRPDAATIAGANLTAFMNHLGVADHEELVRRSNDEPAWFHDALIDFIDFRFYQPYAEVIDESGGLPWVKWCVGGTTNVALNCLDRWLEAGQGGKTAIDWEGEDGSTLSWTYDQLQAETCRLAGGLRGLGLGPGDVIGVYLPNIPQAAVALLAITKIGAIALPLFSGFAAEAVADRLAYGEAKAVITVDGAPRRGRVAGAKSVIDTAAAAVPSLRHVIVFSHHQASHDWVDGRDHWWADLVAGQPDTAPTQEMDAEAPMMLVFTSGTTGKPKGVVHSHCGFPIKIALDVGIYMDFKPSDRFLWMSDMGWLVGPILVYGALLLGGTVVLVEGAPDFPQPDRFWRLIDRHRVSFLGVAPTLVRAMMANPAADPDRHDLSSLRIFTSTGEPWTPESWLWLFDRVGKGRLPLINYSGGTELGGIVTSTVIHPMKPCSFVTAIPGTGADVVDRGGNGIARGTVGELAMRRPSIGLTRGLWQDPERYLDSYWRQIPDMWVHGDFASIDDDGYWFIYGRSDDTLNVAGKRTGPAEIEALLLGTERIAEAAVIGAPDPIKGTAIVAVCVPRDGSGSPEELRDALSVAVVAGLGPPFRPKAILFCDDLPKTRNMKIMRRLVRSVLLGEAPGDLSSLVNPEAVEGLKPLAGEIGSGAG